VSGSWIAAERISTTILEMADPLITVSADPHSSQESLIAQFSDAETLTELPAVVDITQRTPPNPPARIQEQFVGSSYEAAYSEAFSFTNVVGQWSTENGRGTLPTLGRILDFGSGWGRITRVLLTKKVHPRQVIAADVDQAMTALVNVSLPGITALTVDPMPPTVLNADTFDLVTAYSVFSHLSPAAHEAWAQEFGRLVVDGGLVVLTVLDHAFFEQIQWSINDAKAGNATPAANSLAGAFPDLAAATAAFDRGDIVYSGTGGAGVRTGDYYGWAAASKPYIENTWGAAGFDIVQWVPSGVLFQQAAVALRRRPRAVHPAGAVSQARDVPPATWGGALLAVARAARASVSKLGLGRK
jgi:SAM-dependent methyltransferase